MSIEILNELEMALKKKIYSNNTIWIKYANPIVLYRAQKDMKYVYQ